MSNIHWNSNGPSFNSMTPNQRRLLKGQGQSAFVPVYITAALSSGMTGLSPLEKQTFNGGTLRVAGQGTFDSDMKFDSHSSANGRRADGTGSFGLDAFGPLRTMTTSLFRGTVAEHNGHSYGMMRSSDQHSNRMGLPSYRRSMTSGIEASLRLQQLQDQLALLQRQRAASSLVVSRQAVTPMANAMTMTPNRTDTLLGPMPSQQVAHSHQQRHITLPQPRVSGLNSREELLQAYLSGTHFENCNRTAMGVSHDMRADRIKRSHQEMFKTTPSGSVIPTSALTPLLTARMLPSYLNVQVTKAGDASPILPALLFRPSDLPKLSQLQIFLRQQVEVFSATEFDVMTIRVGQVGLRCRHCAHVPSMKRGKGSTYFPTSVWGFYQASQNMCSVHFQNNVCRDLPSLIQARSVELVAHRKEQKSGNSGAGREYWAMTGKQMGLVDMEDGVYHIHNLPAGVSLPVEEDSSRVYRVTGLGKKMKL